MNDDRVTESALNVHNIVQMLLLLFTLLGSKLGDVETIDFLLSALEEESNIGLYVGASIGTLAAVFSIGLSVVVLFLRRKKYQGMKNLYTVTYNCILHSNFLLVFGMFGTTFRDFYLSNKCSSTSLYLIWINNRCASNAIDESYVDASYVGVLNVRPCVFKVCVYKDDLLTCWLTTN